MRMEPSLHTQDSCSAAMQLPVEPLTPLCLKAEFQCNQAREKKGTFFTTWTPLAVAPIVAPPPPTTFLEILPILDQLERDLFDTVQFLVPCDVVLHIVCTQSVVFASGGGAASPKASFGWVLSTNQGRRLLHISGPACRAHSNSHRAEGCGILSVVPLFFGCKVSSLER